MPYEPPATLAAGVRILISRSAHWIVCLAIGGCSVSPGSGTIHPYGDDVENLGHPDDVLSWSPEQQLAGFRNYARVFPTRIVPASGGPSALPRNLRDLSGLRYQVDGNSLDLQGFKEHNHIAGLLHIKNGTIVLEDYERGNDPETRWVSYSVAKSVVSLLVGAAIQDGYISSVDDFVTDYLPLLEGSPALFHKRFPELAAEATNFEFLKPRCLPTNADALKTH